MDSQNAIANKSQTACKLALRSVYKFSKRERLMAFIKQFKSQIILTAAFIVLIGVGIAIS